MIADGWELVFSERFLTELLNFPREIQRRLAKKAIPDLRARGDQADGDTMKKLKGWRFLYRYRLGDYRLVYRVSRELRRVEILRLGNRKDLYTKLHLSDDGPPKPDIMLSVSESELECEPTPGELTAALNSTTNLEDPKDPLPQTIDEQLLESLSIDRKYWDELLGTRTGSDLLFLVDKLPDNAGVERVFDSLFPPSLADTLQGAMRSGSAQDLESLIDGKVGSESFMLLLDEDQKAFLSRIQGSKPSGPWLIKGGPGSGKSLLALYAIRRIAELASVSLRLDGPVRILFTTYTTSLTRTARLLLDHLIVSTPSIEVEVLTVDRLIAQYVEKGTWVYSDQARPTLQEILSEKGKKDPDFSFKASDSDFLLSEIEWVILGQGVRSLTEYQAVLRPGRGRRLGSRQRADVWRSYMALRGRLGEKGKRLWGERAREALNRAEPKYDYVFIDEAQDLPLACLRFLAKLCTSSKGIFVTADTNQSIYGAGMPWSAVAEDLKFRGRARIFRRNYRNPKPIWDAVLPFATGVAEADAETLEVEAFRDGEEPLLLIYEEEQSSAVEGALRELREAERLPYSHCVLLAPTTALVAHLAASLPSEMRAKPMPSREFDLQHRGVKVTTFHASKGLEFPIVVVAGLEDHLFPWSDALEDELKLAQCRRLLFVAASRATRRLALVAPKIGRSRFLDLINPDQWTIRPHLPA